MSDAKNRLQEALNKAKAKKVPKAPVVSARKASPQQRQNRAPAPKKTEASPKKTPKQPKKKAPGNSSGLFKNIQNFASTVIDELKTATSEIAPGALLATANDGIKSLRKAISSEKGPADTSASEESVPQAPAPDSARPLNAASATPPPSNRAAKSAQKEQPVQYTSPAKVQRIASKKKADDETEMLAQLESAPSAPAAEPSIAPHAESPPTAPAEFTSPAKVQRAASKKKTDGETEMLAQLESAPSAPAATQTASPLPFEPPDPAHRAMTSPAKVQRTASLQKGQAHEAPIAESDSARDMPQEDRSERSPAQAEAPREAPHASGETAASKSPAPKKPARPMRQAAISKEEHAVRSFRALQTVLANPIWAPVTTDPGIKPSSLYAPRAQFDAHFGNPVFREGLKAASRLAGISSLPPDKVNFNPTTIQQVIAFNIDPQEKIKPHTEIFTSVLDEETVKKILALMQDKSVKYLLFSVGTRLGSFVPTLEMLARIYLGMRKKEPITSGDRLKIQADILMRYQKAPYTEEIAQKARNLAVNYFLDYLTDYAIKEYKEGQKTAPRSTENAESQQRRHAALSASCCNTIDEWGQKLALPAASLNSVKGRLMETIDHLFQQTADSQSVSEHEMLK